MVGDAPEGMNKVMEKSVLIYAGVSLVILVVVVEILIARYARRRESSDWEVNVSAPATRLKSSPVPRNSIETVVRLKKRETELRSALNNLVVRRLPENGRASRSNIE